MIGAASQWSDNAFHLKREEKGRQLTNGNVGLDTNDVQLQVIGLL